MKSPIPINVKGHQLNIREEKEFDNREDAYHFYTIAKHRLLNIDNWDDICALPLATFSLYTVDDSVKKTDGPKVGDFVKIKIPFPLFAAQSEFDWVKIEEITDEEMDDFKRTCIVLRPTDDPTSDIATTAHFFKPSATSSICVEQHRNLVVVVYAGRNQQANTSPNNIAVKLRNTLVTVGAKLGASYPQWKSLVKGIIRA